MRILVAALVGLVYAAIIAQAAAQFARWAGSPEALVALLRTPRGILYAVLTILYGALAMWIAWSVPRGTPGAKPALVVGALAATPGLLALAGAAAHVLGLLALAGCDDMGRIESGAICPDTPAGRIADFGSSAFQRAITALPLAVGPLVFAAGFGIAAAAALTVTALRALARALSPRR